MQCATPTDDATRHRAVQRPLVEPDVVESLARTAGELLDLHAGVRDVQVKAEQATRDVAEALKAVLRLAAVGSPVEAFAPLVDAVDRAILTALLEGVSARALPGRVGLKKHVVRERVARMKVLTGADTLFQLGVAAGAFGWVDPPQTPADTES
ncbi:MAG TPA: AsnC family protein [Mycobacteriales bacterium]|jgi:23S rRNA A2030 N6-methylase RlmJ|nr:AsnC family protein [Mycobacteriales bacterium]